MPNIWQTPISSTPDSKRGRYSGRGDVEPALLEGRLLRAVAGVMHLGDGDVLGLGGDVTLQGHHVAACDCQRVAGDQGDVALQAADRGAGVADSSRVGLGLDRLLADGETNTAAAHQAGFDRLFVVRLAMRTLCRFQGQVVAGRQDHVAGADDLRALREQIVACGNRLAAVGQLMLTISAERTFQRELISPSTEINVIFELPRHYTR